MNNARVAITSLAASLLVTSTIAFAGIGAVPANAGEADNLAAPALTDSQIALVQPLRPDQAAFVENRGLSEAAVAARQASINSTYSVGEPFSPSDAEFIRVYAQPNPDVFGAAAAKQGRASLSFSQSKTASGVTGKISGKLSTDGSGPITHKYSVAVNMTSTAKATKTKIQADIRSYGVVGSSGIGLTYSTSPSVTTTAHSYAFNRSRSYTSVAVYDTISASATFSASNGSFTVTS